MVEKPFGDTGITLDILLLFCMVAAEYGQCCSIFSVASHFCMTWEGQRHLFFHVGTTGGSSRFTASLLIHPDMSPTKTHTDIVYATGLGSTQKDYSVTWWPLRMVPACNLLPFLWAIPSFIWSGRRLRQQQHHKGPAPPCRVLARLREGGRDRERIRVRWIPVWVTNAVCAGECVYKRGRIREGD